MSSPILVVEGVRKSYGTRRILDVSRLVLASGKSYVLTGDNGSGKSTLLRVLAGMEDAEVDLYLFNGRSVSLRSYPEWLRHDLIYVHQHPYLFRGSIFDNICYGLKARGMTRASCEPQVREAIVWAGVDELLNVPSHRLSGARNNEWLWRARACSIRDYFFWMNRQPIWMLKHVSKH
ncbi:MAG: ATP-binding cassette domain-containing protein [Rhodocyclaceae bacterium]|nr:ATP-binding cassette domain-containing protein [Rhodocyclaceae bacterium]